jgi:hypothetical protein
VILKAMDKIKTMPLTDLAKLAMDNMDQGDDEHVPVGYDHVGQGGVPVGRGGRTAAARADRRLFKSKTISKIGGACSRTGTRRSKRITEFLLN